jgi:cytochrome c oxidase subunit 2
MQVAPLEKRWTVIIGSMLAVMLGSILYTAFAYHAYPPGTTVETVDSTRLHLTEEFREDNLGVTTRPDGSVLVTMVAHRYGFTPKHMEIPAGKPLTLRVATPDVLHGLHIPGTNINTMVVPGYISVVNAVIDYDEIVKHGELDDDGSVMVPVFCNEFCGLNHHFMWGEVLILPES